jgi:hypothetical protein
MPEKPPADLRLPLKIRQLPGGYAIEFPDGRRPVMVWGREPHVAAAAKALTIDEARELAQEIARALTAAWSAHE